MGKDFSGSVKTTPALKGETKIIPLGNKKGDFEVNLSFRKISSRTSVFKK